MAAQIPIVAATSTPAVARNSKKRPASPSHNSSGGGYGASKKKKLSASGFAQGVSIEAMNESKMASSELSSGPVEKAAKPLPFKDPNFVHSGHGGAVAGKKNRTWKNLKQILAAERALPWQLNDPNYFSIDAPPSFKPAKKYSDISGLLLDLVVSEQMWKLSPWCVHFLLSHGQQLAQWLSPVKRQNIVLKNITSSCMPTTQTLRASCGSARLRNSPTFAGCLRMWSQATWP
uniref:INO80 complex subunit C n=1 Tax=Mus musculus TaxID=10090 RepID=F8WIA0_MOUSE